MIAILKFVHIAAIAIWTAGLISLPSLYVQRAHVTSNDSLYRMQRMVRFAYVAMISPAAFIAVSSGIALSFARDVFSPWFSWKLGFVALLAMFHVFSGLVIIRLFKEGEVYPPWRFMLATVSCCAVVAAILVLVLAKEAPVFSLPRVMGEPGGLKRLLDPFNPWATP
ncbi:CopD family protein [Rhizobium sp. AG855]|uniref:CopD family protein n=1 Tax=Rhizobium sp. AG855 TaxID=2183898 RepID=UPI000E75FF9B|nr:CopD family protein [Rhizobium sp. AG855]RKE77570.1 putative membrane protein [Rhizobium sp. AG855]